MKNPFESFLNALNPIREKIKAAEECALDHERFRDISQRTTDLEIKMHKGDISTSEEEEYQELKRELNDSTIILQTSEELREALETIGINKAQIKDVVDHEQQHILAAEQKGGKSNGYICTIFRSSKSPTGFGVHVSVDIDLPESADQAEKNAILREIITAPEQNGGETSKGDRYILNKI